MMWIPLMLAVVLVGLTVAAVLGRVDGTLREPTSSLSYVPLPGDRITPDDINALRIDTAMRGYRMEQVDEVIERLAGEIEALTAQLQLLAPGEPVAAASTLDPGHRPTAEEATGVDDPSIYQRPASAEPA